MKNEKETFSTSSGQDPQSRIKCPLFVSKNEDAKQIAKAINEATDIKKKKTLAKDYLAKQAEELLTCKYFRRGRVECKMCQEISKTRLKTAQLIIKAAELK